MLPLDKHAKVFTVTSSSDLRLRDQRSKKVKFQIKLNGKTNGVNMLALGKHAKVSTVTSLCDLWLRDQSSKKVKFQIGNQYKDVYQCLLADTDLLLHIRSKTNVYCFSCILLLLLSTFQMIIAHRQIS